MELLRSFVQIFGGASCRSLVELRADLWWSFVQSFGGASCRASVELRVELR